MHPPSQQHHAAYTIGLLQQYFISLENLNAYWHSKPCEMAKKVYKEKVYGLYAISLGYSARSAQTLDAITGGWTLKAQPR